MSCTEIQQQLAWGEALSPQQRAHAADCPHCLKVATDYSLLDETLNAMAAPVPPTFADRVMTRILEEETVPRAAGLRDWLGKRWVQFALVYGGGVVAALNVARFLAGVLTTSIGLGGVQ